MCPYGCVFLGRGVIRESPLRQRLICITKIYWFFLEKFQINESDMITTGNKCRIINVQDIEIRANIFTISLVSVEFSRSLNSCEEDVDEV